MREPNVVYNVRAPALIEPYLKTRVVSSLHELEIGGTQSRASFRNRDGFRMVRCVHAAIFSISASISIGDGAPRKVSFGEEGIIRNPLIEA